MSMLFSVSSNICLQ